MGVIESAFSRAWEQVKGEYSQAWVDQFKVYGQGGLTSRPVGFWTEYDLQWHFACALKDALVGLGSDADVYINMKLSTGNFSDSRQLYESIERMGDGKFQPDILVMGRTDPIFSLLVEMKMHYSLHEKKPTDLVHLKNRIGSYSNDVYGSYWNDVRALTLAVNCGVTTLGYFCVIDDRFFDSDGIGLKDEFEREAVQSCPQGVRVWSWGVSYEKKNSLLQRAKEKG